MKIPALRLSSESTWVEVNPEAVLFVKKSVCTLIVVFAAAAVKLPNSKNTCNESGISPILFSLVSISCTSTCVPPEKYLRIVLVPLAKSQRSRSYYPLLSSRIRYCTQLLKQPGWSGCISRRLDSGRHLCPFGILSGVDPRSLMMQVLV